MSVQARTYVIYGLMLPYDKVTFEQVEQYDADHADASEGEVGCLYDGMSGKYVCFGVVFARSDEFGQFEEPFTLPDVHATHEGTMVSNMTWWKAATSDALDKAGLIPVALGLKFDWHVITHFR